MNDQPEALRVAHELVCRALINGISPDDDFVTELDAARLLREQHAEIERLRNDLSNIQFQAQLVRDYVLQLNDDCDAAVKK